jgi:5-methylcytosine-specific restriction protein A
MYDAARPSPSRIYGRRWQRLRIAYLAQHPLCECDEVLLFDWDNLQAMTKACHDRKTAARDGGFGNPRR